MQRLFLAFSCLVLALAGCQDSARRKVPPPDYTLPPASPWIDPAVQLSSAVRLTTRSGLDLRRALFAPAGSANERQVLIQLRDYTNKPTDAPDPQSVYILDLESEDLVEVEGLPSTLAGIYPAVSGDGWLAAGLVAAEGQPWKSGTLMIASIAPDASVTTWNTQTQLWPLGVLLGQGLSTVPFTQIELSAGLPMPAFAWQDKLQRLDPATQVVRPQAGPWILLGQAGLAAGLMLDYDPALPVQARLRYFAAPGADIRQQCEWGFGYFPGNGHAAWVPPLAPVDEMNLAAIVFQADGSGQGPDGGAGGVFRLLVLNAEAGTADVIEDHLPPDLPIAADQGVVFYTRQAWAGDRMRWEAWASSPDGMRKHLLYSTADAIYLAVEDAAGGRRILLNRQYLVVNDGKPELHSELHELSLDPLVDAGAAAEVEPLSTPTREEIEPDAVNADASKGNELFSPPGVKAEPPEQGGQPAKPPASGGDGPPPIAIPN